MRAGGLRARAPPSLLLARPTARKVVGRGRPESAQPSVSRPAPPRIPEVGARWLFVCVLFFYLFRVHVRRSEDNLWEFLFSFHHVGPSNRTQIERPGSPSWPTSSCPAGLKKGVKTAVTGGRHSRTSSPLPKNHRGRIGGGLAFSLVITLTCSGHREGT